MLVKNSGRESLPRVPFLCLKTLSHQNWDVCSHYPFAWIRQSGWGRAAQPSCTELPSSQPTGHVPSLPTWLLRCLSHVPIAHSLLPKMIVPWHWEILHLRVSFWWRMKCNTGRPEFPTPLKFPSLSTVLKISTTALVGKVRRDDFFSCCVISRLSLLSHFLAIFYTK